MATEVTVSTGDLGTSEFLLDVGPQHPASHGTLRLALRIDGDTITHAEPVVGFMHRGAEKLFEARDYRQILMLANRHDWLSAFSNELGIAIAVERMLGIEVPERARWARTLLAELNRVLSHLVFLGTFPPELGDTPPTAAAFHSREAIQGVMEAATGGRMHFMFNRVGGLKEDLPDGWLEAVRRVLADVRHEVRRDVAPAIHDNGTIRARTRGIGRLDRATAAGLGVSGPIARASGLDLDLRRDDPYLSYAEVPTNVLRIVGRGEGDVLARFECLLDQVEVSLDIADHCLDRLIELGPGPVNVRLPKVVKAPEGETYAWTENPLGINGYYLVSRGERTPWRLKLRTASFNNVQALSAALPGSLVADLVPILCSMFFVVGDIDK